MNKLRVPRLAQRSIRISSLSLFGTFSIYILSYPPSIDNSPSLLSTSLPCRDREDLMSNSHINKHIRSRHRLLLCQWQVRNRSSVKKPNYEAKMFTANFVCRRHGLEIGSSSTRIDTYVQSRPKGHHLRRILTSHLLFYIKLPLQTIVVLYRHDVPSYPCSVCHVSISHTTSLTGRFSL
jgi:hypothetical protein